MYQSKKLLFTLIVVFSFSLLLHTATLKIKFIEPVVTKVTDNNGQEVTTVATIEKGRNQYYAFREKNELSNYESFFQKRFDRSKIIKETMKLRREAREIAIKHGQKPDSPQTPVYIYVDTDRLFGGTGPALIPMKLFIAPAGTTDQNLSSSKGKLVNSLIVLSDIVSNGKTILSLQKLIKEGYLEVVIAHENSHGMMADLCGASYNKAQILNSVSTNGHDADVVSDTFLAYSEGWAEGFEAYMGEKFADELNPAEKKGIKKVVEKVLTASGSEKAATKSKFPDIAKMLKKKRQSPIQRNKYVFKDYSKRDGKVKNGLQIISSEGAIASQFFLTLLHSGISNSFEKCATIMAKYKVFNWGDFVKAFVKEYPQDKNKILRLFLEFTKYAPAWNEARQLYYNYYTAKKKYVQKKISKDEFYAIKKDWENQKEEIFKAIASGKINPTASTGKPIWITFGDNWRCDLNSANANEIAVGIYNNFKKSGMSVEEAKKIAIANAVAVITKRESKGYFSSFNAVKKEVDSKVWKLFKKARNTFQKELAQRKEVAKSKDLFQVAPYFRDNFLIYTLTKPKRQSYINVNKGNKIIDLFDLRNHELGAIKDFYKTYQKYIPKTSYLNRVLQQVAKSE